MRQGAWHVRVPRVKEWVMTARLRSWQSAARERFHASDHSSFLCVATPGAGKTTYALMIARDLLDAGSVTRIVVVAPTDHLRRQWAIAAARVGLHIDPDLPNSVHGVRRGFHGYATTYAAVASRTNVHLWRAQSAPTLVILDEVHHCADGNTYGEAISSAFSPAYRRLLLSGTPFRSAAEERIPFVRYSQDHDGGADCVPDFSYTYSDALADGVVRPVVFAAYSGTSRWIDDDGDEVSSGLSDEQAERQLAKAWRAALDPAGAWIRHVIAAADARLDDIRASGMPDAGAMIVAADQDTARAYARIVTEVTGHPCAVAVSEDARAADTIEEFRRGTTRWLASVRLVSEGTDVPRLAVGVLANAARTQLMFEQMVGRFVRARDRHEHATVFVPAVRPLLAHAANLESPRTYQVIAKSPLPEDFEPVVRERSEPTTTFAAVGSEAQFAHVLANGKAVIAEPTLFDDVEPEPIAGGSAPVDPYADLDPEQAELLGIPGLLDPAAVAQTLASHEARIKATMTAAPAPVATESDPEPLFEQAARLRREVNSLVGRIAARTGTPHGAVHAQTQRAVPGPASRSASVDVLTRRRDYLLSRIR